MKYKLILIILISMFSSSCVIVQQQMPNKAEDWNSSKYNKVRDYNKYEKVILEKYHAEQIGLISYSTGNYKIYEINIDNGKDKTVLIFGGIHGDEEAGIESSFLFIDQVTNMGRKDYNYIFVPIVNPWGWEHNSRYNYNGFDINRDFSGGQYSTQEARVIIERYKEVKTEIVIDNHESNWQNDNFFFVYNKETKRVMEKFINDNQNYKYDNNSNYTIYKARNGIIYINSSILGLVIVSNRWALSNFFLINTPHVVVIESGVQNELIENRNKFHIDAMTYILDTFTN